ncbi:hypothetical protein F4815DRAFT_487451 [Daldinia loculata]|nr:hypothetical protein F4815DRAFT_487451 [Daldinia loculata]
MYGGLKLVGVNLTTNTVFKTTVFPGTVTYGDSYLNNVRLDLRSNLSDSPGEGFTYITDSSTFGHNALIIVDFGSGESWRHLGLTKSIHVQRPDSQASWTRRC